MVVKILIKDIPYDKFLTLVISCLIAIIIVGIIIIVVVKIVEHGRTKRAEILSKIAPLEKKKEIIGKQFEKEIENKGKFIMFVERIINMIGK